MHHEAWSTSTAAVPPLQPATPHCCRGAHLGMGTLLPGRVAALSAFSVSVPSAMSWEPALPRICSSGLPGLAVATASDREQGGRRAVVGRRCRCRLVAHPAAADIPCQRCSG